MSEGIFRGTCKKYVLSELIVPREGGRLGYEVRYLPRGDFTYSLFEAAGFAYDRALETNSEPLVACLLDQSFVSDRGVHVPLSKVKFIGIEEVKALEELLKFYDDNLPIIPDGQDRRTEIGVLRAVWKEYERRKYERRKSSSPNK